MAAVSARRLLLWKAIAFFSFGLAASALAWAFRRREQQPPAVPNLIVVPDLDDELPATGTSPLRQSDRDDAIVITIDDLDFSDEHVQEWIQVPAPLPTPSAVDPEDFPVPRFNAHHHHH